MQTATSCGGGSTGWYARISDLWNTVTSGFRTGGSSKYGASCSQSKEVTAETWENNWVEDKQSFVTAEVCESVINLTKH